MTSVSIYFSQKINKNQDTIVPDGERASLVLDNNVNNAEIRMKLLCN
jgi:hypothetical protein